MAGHVEEAVPELEHCLELARKPEGQADLDRALHALGYVRTLAGRPRDGEPLLRKALEMRTRLYPHNDYRVAQIQIELGECLERQGRAAEARPLYQAASDAFRHDFGPDVWISQFAATYLQRLSP